MAVSKNKLIFLILMLVALLLWCKMNSTATSLISQNIGLRYTPLKASDSESGGTISGAHITAKDIVDLPFDEANPTVMLWNEHANTSITTPSNGTAIATLIEIFGANLLRVNIIDGSPLSSNDTTGCTLDSETAYALFGTVNAVGMSVIIDEKDYVIRGIIDSNQQTIICNTQDEDTAFFSAELLFEDTQNGRDDALSFIQKYDLAFPKVIVDSSLITILVALVSSLPAILLTVVILLRLLARMMRVRRQTLLFILVLIFTFLAVAGMVIAFDLQTQIPLRFIPSRWSDFSFWGVQLGNIITQFKEIISAQTIMDKALISQLVLMVVFVIGLIFALTLFLERVSIKSQKQLLIWGLISEVIVFTFYVTMGGVGGIGLEREIILALPCYFVIDFMVRRWDDFLTPYSTLKKENINEYQKSLTTQA